MTMTTIITAMTTAIARLGPSTPPTIAVSVLDRPAAVPVTVYRDYMKRHTYVLYGGYFRGCYIIVLWRSVDYRNRAMSPKAFVTCSYTLTEFSIWEPLPIYPFNWSAKHNVGSFCESQKMPQNHIEDNCRNLNFGNKFSPMQYTCSSPFPPTTMQSLIEDKKISVTNFLADGKVGKNLLLAKISI